MGSKFGYGACTVRTYTCLSMPRKQAEKSRIRGAASLEQTLAALAQAEPGAELCFFDDTYRVDYARTITIPALAVARNVLEHRCAASSAFADKKMLLASIMGLAETRAVQETSVIMDAILALLERERSVRLAAFFLHISILLGGGIKLYR